MAPAIRFGVLSDLHITLPHTLRDYRHRSHFLEISLGALEFVLQDLEDQNLDFLLIPGDLTQDGELENHRWLANRLSQLKIPAFVIPGNHDLRDEQRLEKLQSMAEFFHEIHGAARRGHTVR